MAQSLSISEAATRLFISQPSLSTAIRELEKEAGIAIFSRTSRGVSVTRDGAEFLAYARQIVEQAELLEQRYGNYKPVRRLFSVSTQHYAFAVNAFVETVKDLGADEYECTIRETKTYEILEDVRSLKSDLGILYRNEFNGRVLDRLFHEYDLVFTPLFRAKPHIFVSTSHPLARKKKVSLEDLEPWPCLSFEQGEHNSFHFSEEIHSTRITKKSIHVSDRATLFNLLIGLEGYTISTGILTEDLNGKSIASVPLESADTITVGYVTRKGTAQGHSLAIYLRHLNDIVKNYSKK